MQPVRLQVNAMPARRQRRSQISTCAWLQQRLAARQTRKPVLLCPAQAFTMGHDLVDRERVRNFIEFACRRRSLDPRALGGAPGRDRVTPRTTQITLAQTDE